MQPVRSVSLAIALLGAALSVTASRAAADPAPLAPGSSAELAAHEGHLALVFDSMNRIENARFTGRGSYSVKFDLDEVPEGIHLFVLRVPEGSYCFDSLRAGKVRYKRKDENNQFCISVRAGGLTYRGHYAPRAGVGKAGVLNIEPKPVEFLTRMKAEQPLILAAHDEVDDGTDGAEPRRASNMRALG